MELNEFLVKANINTYASNGEGGEKTMEDGNKEFVYKEGDWKYRDRYFGSHSFIGEEVVWKNGKIVWGMNYYGKILSESIEKESLYNFLKKALRQVEKEMPFRGPKMLKDGDFVYANSSGGFLENFKGEEVIFYKDEKVYELKYHGGEIKN